MIKIIEAISVIILISLLALIFVLIFNPGDLRTRLISFAINSYLKNAISDYAPLPEQANTAAVDDAAPDKHPLLNTEQEKILEGFGVDISRLPASVSPGMAECFIEKLGRERADEIMGGAMPGALEVVKTASCLSL